MIITSDLLDKKVPLEMFPTRLDSATNLYTYVDGKGLILYNVVPDTWNCLYTFYELNHKFTVDNYEFKNKDITFREMIDEYKRQYHKIYEEKSGFTKEKRKDILISEYSKTFDVGKVNICDELDCIYELKYSKSKKVWTLYYFENYVADRVDNLEKLLEQKIYKQEFLKLDEDVDNIDGTEIIGNVLHLLKSGENKNKLLMNKLEEAFSLENFLICAKKSTYADADSSSKTSFSRVGSKDYEFKSDGMIYHDTYFGGTNFIGEEIVYNEENVPIWGMNYYGVTLEDNLSEEAMDKALRPALSQVGSDRSVLAVRGPSIFLNDEYKYTFNSQGDINCFSGIEEIYKDDKLIYRLDCHGGLIK